jgi:glycosyltransferase involved in cell wall biosynthesis
VRVFIGLTEVAGYFVNLERGLRELGVETMFVDLDDHPYEYAEAASRADRLVVLHRAFHRRRIGAEDAGRRLSSLWWAYLQKTCLLLLLVRAAITCDAFIFSSDSTFFRYQDLRLLRLLRKRIIFVYTGSDHRPAYLNGATVGSLDAVAINRCAEQSRRIKAKLRSVERHADVIVGHHLSAHFHERPIVPFLLVGFPSTVVVRPLTAAVEPAQLPAVRIVHAPSRPLHKGTTEIRRAIDNLRARGHEIEFVELVDVPNRTVVAELARCDFVVDELYSDTRMAGLATEAASLGKPSVVGGYAYDEVLEIEGVYVPADFPPVEFCHPDQLEQAIERLISDVPYRLELGRRAREFVSSNWTPVSVARRYLALIEDRVPEGWAFDPRRIRYYAGTGMPESVARTGVRRLIEAYGTGALCLLDKPEMEAAFVAFASIPVA